MSQYKHFSYQERVELARMIHEKVPKVAIGQCLGRPRSSIDREIARNGNKDGTYNADTAQRRYEARRRRGSMPHGKRVVWKTSMAGCAAICRGILILTQ